MSLSSLWDVLHKSATASCPTDLLAARDEAIAATVAIAGASRLKPKEKSKAGAPAAQRLTAEQTAHTSREPVAAEIQIGREGRSDER